MTCPSDSAFEKFVADQLPQELESQIAGHLETCEACRRRAEAIYGGEYLRPLTHSGTIADDATFVEPADLRDNLYRLVGHGQEATFSAAVPTADLFRLLTAEPTDDVAGTKLARFTVRRWLGSGAFGVVFLAYDELLHREVALKLPRAQPLARREARERFLREAEAAAKLHHPNVVPVFEAGQEQGICYIASAYCPGPTLADWLAQQTEPVRLHKAAALVRELAGAVQHAHEHGVLHRDIKPSNVLLETELTDPQSMTPMITDFGLAKLLDASVTDGSLTGSQGMLGTPRYMAPEQATGDRKLIGPAADIFALGAILYELLVKVAPYAGGDQARTLHRILHDRVTAPRRLRRELPRDLEAICLKCLEKKPQDRYVSAQELADDLRRFEEGRSTRARPIGRLEMLRRWTIRQPAIAAMLALTAVGLLALLSIFVAYNRSLRSFNKEIETALRDTRDAQHALELQDARLRHLLYVSKIELAHQAVKENDLHQASRLLSEAAHEVPDATPSFVWRYLRNQTTAPGQLVAHSAADIYDLTLSPDGGRLAACGADAVLRIYDSATFAPLLSFATDQEEINSVSFSPDGQRIATAGDDGTVRLWDAETGEPQRTIQAHERFAYDVVFSSDGETLISCGREPLIRLWDVRSGEPLRTLQGHSGAVEAIVLAPDGKHLASASSDETARIWNLESGESLHLLQGHDNRVVDVRYAPHGDYLLTGSIDHTIRLWRTADGESLQIETHVDAIASVAFLKGDNQLVAADRGGTVHVWQRRPNAAAPEPASAPLHSWKAHEGRIWEVTTTRDQTGLLTAGADGNVYRWKPPTTAQQLLKLEADHSIDGLTFDPLHRRLYFIDSTAGICMWDFASDQHSTLVPQSDFRGRQAVALCALADQRLMVAFDDSTLDVFALPSAEREIPLKLPWESVPDYSAHDLAASQDGGRLALFSHHRDVALVLDVAEKRFSKPFEAYSEAMAISPDGTQLAMSDGDDVVLWNIDPQRRIARLRGHTSSVVTLNFSPDGRTLASGSKDRHIRLWDLAGNRETVVLSGHRDEVVGVTFAPNGRLLASGGRRGEVKFWFLPEPAELISIEGLPPIARLMFSPQGDHLAIQCGGQIHILDGSNK